MEVEVDEEELKSAGADFLFFHGREIDSHVASGNDIRFNALDAFSGWKHEGLPPVKVPSAAQWKFRTQGKKFQRGAQASIGRIAHCGLMSLRSHEKNQFFSVMREVFMFVTQVVLYEDELADNKVSLLTVKVTEEKLIKGAFGNGDQIRTLEHSSLLQIVGHPHPLCFWMESHIWPFFEKDVGRKQHINLYLLQKGYPTDSAAYGDPSISSQRLPVIVHLTQKHLFPGNLPLPVQTICTEQTRQNLDLEIVGPQLYQLDLKFRESDNVDEWGYYRKRIS
ncbi:hypothetical protein GOBAR_AA34969 [Gossypium barbadense]|uniref:Uncharacterized protein n=1 Tax=Gossypium barbadense TaxID=3634 RepID=A0A2P5W3U2_GOSBA|nr:hypothetical protein GOBAR_AA34969 [Gossypium barbadense]